MQILVNGNIETLSITDPKTGCNFEQDLIGNAGGFDGFDEDQTLYKMTLDNYEWWVSYLLAEQSLIAYIESLRIELSNKHRRVFDAELIECGDSDYELMQAAQIEVVEKWQSAIND
jgi:hypothetical protein